jgi:DNA-binding GntR family transcriptional regulator
MRVDLQSDGVAPRRTAHEYARDRLRQAILDGELVAGSRLVQSELAIRLEVSTTPIREALRDLATEGLVRLDPHRGATVRSLSFVELQEVQRLSGVLEPLAIQDVAPVMSDHELAIAEELVVAMEGEDDIGRWTDLNRQFHAILLAGLEGTRLHGILESLRDAAAPYVSRALLEPENQLAQASSDHRELLAALRAGDGERAAEISRRHAELTMAVLARSRQIFESSEPVT